MDLTTGNISVADIYGHEPNHVDDHRRGRDAGDEVTSTAAGDRLSEILGENGKSSGFDLSEWLSNNDNKQALIDGKNILDSEYEGYEMEGHPYKAPTNPNYYYNPNQPMDKKPSNADIYYDYGKVIKPIDPQDITDLGSVFLSMLNPKNEEKNDSNNSGSSSNGKNKYNSSTKANEKTCDIECFTKNLNKDYYYNPLNAVMEEKKQFDDYFNPMSLIPEEKIFADLYSGLVNYKNEFYRRYDLVMEQQTEAFKRGQVPENWSEGDQEAFRSYPGNENKTVFNPKTLVNEGRWTDQDYKDYLNAPVRVVQQTLPVAEVFYDAYLGYSLSKKQVQYSEFSSEIKGVGLDYDHLSEFDINKRYQVVGSHVESIFTNLDNYTQKSKILRIDSVEFHPLTSDIMEVKYSLATMKDGNGVLIPQNQLNFKDSYIPKTVISDELISSGKLNIWANEAANNIYYIKDNKGYGLSNNGIVFEFIEPKIPGETFIFYPTLGNPTK